jgi:hypothetical protein
LPTLWHKVAVLVVDIMGDQVLQVVQVVVAVAVALRLLVVLVQQIRDTLAVQEHPMVTVAVAVAALVALAHQECQIQQVVRV